MKLLTAINSEILKTKRTSAFYFTLACAIPIPLIFMLNVLTEGGDVDAVHKGSLNAVFDLGMERTGLLFFPIFIILVCSLLAQTEFRNNTWKQVFTSPQSKASVYIAKFININRLILLFLFANLIYMGLVIIVMHFCNPDRHILQQPFDAKKLLIDNFNSYITLLAVAAIQFWLGLRFRNFIIPIAIGIVLLIIGNILELEYHSESTKWYPYSFQLFAHYTPLKPYIDQVNWKSVVYTAVILLLGFLDFRRRRLVG